jgi:hypothetical protein
MHAKDRGAIRRRPGRGGFNTRGRLASDCENLRPLRCRFKMPAVQIWVLCSRFERLIGHATGTKGSAVYKRADRERSQLEHDATSGRHAAAMIG